MLSITSLGQSFPQIPQFPWPPMWTPRKSTLVEHHRLRSPFLFPFVVQPWNRVPFLPYRNGNTQRVFNFGPPAEVRHFLVSEYVNIKIEFTLTNYTVLNGLKYWLKFEWLLTWGHTLRLSFEYTKFMFPVISNPVSPCISSIPRNLCKHKLKTLIYVSIAWVSIGMINGSIFPIGSSENLNPSFTVRCSKRLVTKRGF